MIAADNGNEIVYHGGNQGSARIWAFGSSQPALTEFRERISTGVPAFCYVHPFQKMQP